MSAPLKSYGLSVFPPVAKLDRRRAKRLLRVEVPRWLLIAELGAGADSVSDYDVRKVLLDVRVVVRACARVLEGKPARLVRIDRIPGPMPEAAEVSALSSLERWVEFLGDVPSGGGYVGVATTLKRALAARQRAATRLAKLEGANGRPDEDA